MGSLYKAVQGVCMGMHGDPVKGSLASCIQQTTLNSSPSEYKCFVRIKCSTELSVGQNLSELTHFM